MSNNSNPYDLDGEQVRNKGTDNDVVRATVIDVLPDAHAVRVNPRGDNAPLVAPVLTPTYGSHTLPSQGERVILVYIAENVPVVAGSVYLLDGEDPPDASEGDIILGNGTGSAVTIHDDGHISIETTGTNRVDVDHQAASVTMTAQDQSVPSGTTAIVEFDTVESDPESLWDAGNYQMVPRAGGQHRIAASVAIPDPGQNNDYALSIYVNGSEEKRTSRQSAVNEELSLDVRTVEGLAVGDMVDIRFTNGSGGSRDILGADVTTEFDFQRIGI